ncbi:putative ribonuclease H-like domain-containing protein [Tanacetum coccineum]
MVPRVVLMKSALVSINTTRQSISKIAVSINTARQVNIAHSKTTVNAARPMSYLSKTAHSTVKRSKSVMAWVPKRNYYSHARCSVQSQIDLQDIGVIDMDAQGTFRGNMSYHTDVLKRIMEDMLLLEGTPKEGKSQEKDETSGIFKSFITGIENLVDLEVKVIRCDNGTEFKNREMNQFCKIKGILRQYSVARTPQQNGVVERRNRTLIKAARTMLVDSKLPTKLLENPPPAINTACYVQNRVLSTPNAVGSGPDWLFDIYALIRTMNYEPIVAGTQSNGFAGTKASDNADPKSSHDDGSNPSSDDGKKVDEDPRKDSECNDQEKEDNVNSTNNVNAASTNKVNAVGGKTSIELPFDPDMPALEDYSIIDFTRDDEDDGVVADMNNLDTTIQVSPIPTTRIDVSFLNPNSNGKREVFSLRLARFGW